MKRNILGLLAITLTCVSTGAIGVTTEMCGNFNMDEIGYIAAAVPPLTVHSQNHLAF
jgi:hypothetical protein